MTSIGNKKQMAALADSLSKKTRFNKQECEGLLNLYKNYSSNRKVDRTVFRDILTTSFEISDDVILDRVFKAFDKDNDSYINPSEWVQGLSVFLRGNFDEQRQFCFDVFDMNNDGFISRDEMFHLLKHCIVKQQSDEDADEGVKDIVDIVLKKMDKDHDARISKAEYWSTVEEDDLLLEAFGQCLPSDKTGPLLGSVGWHCDQLRYYPALNPVRGTQVAVEKGKKCIREFNKLFEKNNDQQEIIHG